MSDPAEPLVVHVYELCGTPLLYLPGERPERAASLVGLLDVTAAELDRLVAELDPGFDAMGGEITIQW